MTQYVRDVKVAKVKIDPKNIVFDEKQKIKSGQRLKFHLRQMVNLIGTVGAAVDAKEDYTELQKTLVSTIVEKTSVIMMKDSMLDIKEVPVIDLEREISYCFPETDYREAIPLDITEHLYMTKPMKNNENYGNSSITEVADNLTETPIQLPAQLTKVCQAIQEEKQFKIDHDIVENTEARIDKTAKRSAAAKTKKAKLTAAAKKGWVTRKANAKKKR